MYAASDEARNTTQAATSSGRPNAPAGIVPSRRFLCSSESLSVMGVVMKPGATQFTVMPREATSAASARATLALGEAALAAGQTGEARTRFEALLERMELAPGGSR